MNYDITGIIPARFSSTRFPGKPLAKIKNKPLIQWVYEQSLKSKLLKEVWVATDSEDILKAVNSFGGKAILTSTIHPSGTDRVFEAGTKLGARNIINIQGDEPTISPLTIDRVARELINNKNEIITAGFYINDKNLKENPNIVKVVLDSKNYALYFSRAPIPFNSDSFIKHIGIYGYSYDVLKSIVESPGCQLEQFEKLEQLRFLYLDFRIKVIMAESDSIGIDIPDDIKKAELYLSQIQD